MKITPVLHRIIVKPDVLEEIDETFKKAKQAGLVFDFSEREREQAAIDTGMVVEVGPTAFLAFDSPNDTIKVGDRIVYAKYGGKVIIDPDTKVKYVALNDEDVIAIITQEGA